MQQSESLWLQQAQRGDEQAFTRLVETYQRPVFNLCYRMLGNLADAEDASQETFLRAYRAMQRYDLNRSFSTWLLSIAAHYCIDVMRKRKLRLISVEELPLPDLHDSSPSVERHVMGAQEGQKIQRLLEALNPTDRAAVVMYYWYEFSYQEISEVLSLTTSAIKSRLHRARKKMADTWEAEQNHTLQESAIPIAESDGFMERMAS